MLILPAIDMIDGKPVRLYQGDYNKKEIVADDVLKTALKFKDSGAKYLHLVDLDGAKNGEYRNHEKAIEVAKKVKIPVELGGGIRTFDTIKYLIDSGISRVILGTSAIEDEELLIKAIHYYKEKIAVSIDCRDGKVCTKGWLKESNYDFIECGKRMEKLGVTNIIVTDIRCDGTLKGPNLDMLAELKNNVNIDITASGGIHNIEDIKNLKKLNLYGAITGKAIYSNTLSLNDAITFAESNL